jgi:hypothetical protein
MSDHAVHTLVKSSTTKGLWLQGVEVPEDFATSFKYAIASASAAVLSLLRERCARAGGGDAAAACSFSAV